MGDREIGLLLGKTLESVTATEYEVAFVAVGGQRFRLYHSQGCCEWVTVEDITGHLDDLIGSPILMAEESSSPDLTEEAAGGSGTWTFYRLATVKGYVNIRWYGVSNGYYSERVDFEEVGVAS